MEFTRRLLVEYKNRLDQIIAEHGRSHALLKQNVSVNMEDSGLNVSVLDSHCEDVGAGVQENLGPAADLDRSSTAGEAGGGDENAGRHEKADGRRASAKSSVKDHGQPKDRSSPAGGSVREDPVEDGARDVSGEGRRVPVCDEETPGCKPAGGCSAQDTGPGEVEGTCPAKNEDEGLLAVRQAVPEAHSFPKEEVYQIELNTIGMSEAPRGAGLKTCLVDETILEDATRIQDQSCFMGNETYTLDALAQYRKRRARRRTGRRIQKRQHEDLPEFPDPVKRMRTDDAKSYLLEYYQMLSKSIKDESSPGAALPSYEDEMSRMKEASRRKKRRMKKLREKLKEIDLLKERLKEMEALKDQEKAAEIERMEEQNKRRMEEESTKRTEELERIKREGLEATKKIEEEMRKFMGFKDEILAQSKIIADHRLEQQMPGGSCADGQAAGCEKRGGLRKTQGRAAVPYESKVFADKNRMSRKGNIGDFFREAKKEHIEKINQTMLSRTWISEKGDANKPKATFNSTVHKPKQPIINVDFIKPHSLYKQSIDVQNIQDDPKNYVPKTFVPFYASEDEFEAEEKKFASAPFTRDPRLLYSVRKQNHGEIRAFFGSQRDIDVETIFSKVENVTNNSPNKFTRRG